MTLIQLPEGKPIPDEYGGGYALKQIEGMTGCYIGMSGLIEFQWPEFEFDDGFAYNEQHQWWQDRFAAIERGDEEPPIDYDARPPDGYGVGDTPEQVMAHPTLTWVHTDPREMVVVFTEIRREWQDPYQGWRFHKNGSYIGVHEVKQEYLYHQDGINGERIDSVVMYCVIQVTTGGAR